MQASPRQDGERPPYHRAAARSRGSLRAGIGLVFLLHLLQILFVAEDPALLAFAGLTQLAYVLPAAIALAFRGRWRSVGGALVGATLTSVLNAIVLIVL